MILCFKRSKNLQQSSKSFKSTLKRKLSVPVISITLYGPIFLT